jgi:hypothetical protein
MDPFTLAYLASHSDISITTVANILKRHGIEPAPERERRSFHRVRRT